MNEYKSLNVTHILFHVILSVKYVFFLLLFTSHVCLKCGIHKTVTASIQSIHRTGRIY